MPSIEELQKEYERLLEETYPDFIIGVDECGKGSIAGPMVICAVAWFPWFHMPTNIRDSKKMTRNQIYSCAHGLRDRQKVPYILGICEPGHIDQVGIERCWEEGVAHVVQMLRWKYDEHDNALAIVDGNKKPQWRTSVEKFYAMPKADTYCLAVQAAAVIAKDHQLTVMRTYAQQFPGYGFGEHAGYGTSKHLEALREKGPCAIHRMSFAPLRGLNGRGEVGKGERNGDDRT